MMGGAVLAGASAFYWMIPSDNLDSLPSDKALEFLNDNDRLILLALIPVMLESTALDSDAIKQCIANIDAIIVSMSLKTQQETRQLFDLLGNKLGRVLMVGIWSNWTQASHEDVVLFLQRWQSHYLELLQVAYEGLHQMIMASYYGEETSWSQIGYPGPPQLS